MSPIGYSEYSSFNAGTESIMCYDTKGVDRDFSRDGGRFKCYVLKGDFLH